MSENQRLHTGDIVQIQGAKIRRTTKSWFHNHFTDQRIKTSLFNIQGLLSNSIPFANGLVKKNFMVTTRIKNYPGPLGGGQAITINLIDNYKPGILGSGYQIEVADTRILKKVGRVVDTKKLPINVAHHLYKTECYNPDNKKLYNTGSLSTIEKIHESRRNYLTMVGMPKHVQWAFLTVKEYYCQDCDCPLWDTTTRLIDLDNVIKHKNEISHEVAAMIIRRHRSNSKVGEVNILPAAFICHNCLFVTYIYELEQRGHKSIKFMSMMHRRELHMSLMEAEIAW